MFVRTQVAAFAGRLPVVQFLLTLGEPAQAERTDQEGLSALHHASIGGKSDIVAEFDDDRKEGAAPRSTMTTRRRRRRRSLLLSWLWSELILLHL